MVFPPVLREFPQRHEEQDSAEYLRGLRTSSELSLCAVLSFLGSLSCELQLLRYPQIQLHLLNSGSTEAPLGPPSSAHPENSLKAVSWGDHMAHVICFPSLQVHCPSSPDVYDLNKCFFIYFLFCFVSFFGGFFCFKIYSLFFSPIIKIIHYPNRQLRKHKNPPRKTTTKAPPSHQPEISAAGVCDKGAPEAVHRVQMMPFKSGQKTEELTLEGRLQ